MISFPIPFPFIIYGSVQVENSIKRAFSVTSYVVLNTDPTGHYLNRSSTQRIDGDKVINRRGALYLVEVSKFVFNGP